jgi:hypothetical protein
MCGQRFLIEYLDTGFQGLSSMFLQRFFLPFFLLGKFQSSRFTSGQRFLLLGKFQGSCFMFG